MGRAKESLLYGTPYYGEITTPDGRIVTEQHRARLDAGRQHEEQIGLQRQVVSALRSMHGGQSTVPRDDVNFSRVSDLMRDTAQGIWGMQSGQHELAHATNYLGSATAAGFEKVGHGLETLQRGLGDMREGFEQGLKEVKGPEYPKQSLSNIDRQHGNFRELYAIYAKGGLNSEGNEQLKKIVNQKFGLSDVERAHIQNQIQKSSHQDKFGLEQALYALQSPANFLGRTTDSDAWGSLNKLEVFCAQVKDPILVSVLRRIRDLINSQGAAENQPISQELMVDLCTSNLLQDAWSHEVKEQHRLARRPGSMVDMNYSILELLEQGDYAYSQGEVQIALQREGLKQGDHAAEQRDDLIALGEEAYSQRQSLIQVGVEQVRQGDQLVALGEEGNSSLKDLVGLGAGLVGLEAESITLQRERVNQGRRAEVLAETVLKQGATMVALEVAHVELTRRGNEQQREIELAHLGALEGVSGGINRGNELAHERLSQGKEAIRIGNTMVDMMGSMDTHLEKIFEQAVANQGALVDLKILTGDILEALEIGFAGVGDFINAGLEKVGFEVGLLRAQMVGQFVSLEKTIKEESRDIVRHIQEGNELLGELVKLANEPLATEARERLRQALVMRETSRNDEEVREVIKFLDRSLDNDPTIPHTHLAKALAAEQIGDFEVAIEEYDLAMRYSNYEGKPNKKLIRTAEFNLGRLLHITGKYLEAIRSLRFVVDDDEKNFEARWLLIRSLALMGFNEEAISHACTLLEIRPEYLIRFKLDPSFTRFPRGDLYRAILAKGSAWSLKLLTAIYEDCLKIEEEALAIKIFRHFLKRPDELLKKGLLENSLLNDQIREKLRTEFHEYIKLGTQWGTQWGAEARYAHVFIALRLELADGEVIKLFESALPQDRSAYIRDKRKIHETLTKIDPHMAERLFNLVRASAPHLI